MHKIYIIFIVFFISSINVFPQKAMYNIKGIVIDAFTREHIPFANVIINESFVGAATDLDGNFIIKNVKPGFVTFNVSCIGYKSITSPEYIISSNTPFITFELEEDTKMLQGVIVTPRMPSIKIEAPVSLRIIGVKEIEKSPGANRDISKIVRLYPGVAFSPIGYRNDLIVRGGGPSENRFFMDGIEIPNINHFATQGASGGPVSIINADLVREINFYTGAFPANRGGALSSVMEIKLRDGNKSKNLFKGTLGASEASFSGNGPINSNTTYLFSIRQSYLQFLFEALGLPFLPTYLDAQIKVKNVYKQKHEFTLLALTGIDRMKLNKDEKGEEIEYILGYLPTIEQETYTIGGSYKHYANHHTQGIYISHSYLNNRITKYKNNDESSEDNLRLKLRSTETKTSLRAENKKQLNNWNLKEGVNLHYSTYSNNTYRLDYNELFNIIDYQTDLNLWSWGAYIMSIYTADDNRYSISGGIRTDATIFGRMKNPLKQLSPRLSLRYNINNKISLATSLGLYYQLPPYTGLGFRNINGFLINKDLKYMRVFQTATGVDWRLSKNFTISTEAFYKHYSNIPLSVVEDIPLTCKGNDYGIVGDEVLVSTAIGRSYGIEMMGKWSNYKKISLTGSLTFYKSEYKNDDASKYINSAWDNNIILNVTANKDFDRNWRAGIKLSYIDGAPYTPYDTYKSSFVEAWEAQGKPYFDFALYNTKKLDNYGQIDVRVDKSYYFKNWMIAFYIDIQNLLASKLKEPDAYLSTGEIVNPNVPLNEQRYKMKYLKQETGNIIPTIGFTIEF